MDTLTTQHQAPIDYPQHIKVNAIALVYQGLSAEDICEKLQVHDTELIYRWNKDQDLVQLAMQTGQIDLLRDQIKSKLLRNANIMIDLALDPEKLKRASSLHLMTAAGIALQKIMELENKGTTNSMQQVNINISHSKDAIEVMSQEEIALQKEIHILEAEIANQATPSTQDELEQLYGI